MKADCCFRKYAAPAAHAFFCFSVLKDAQCEPRIPSHVFALCAQPCVHTQIASLCSESSPQIVQTSPSRLAGASAVTSPIHPSLDACQPGAARAVSMETSNKGARTPPFTCEARGTLRTNRLWGFCRSFITLKQRDQITAQRTCRAAAVSRRRGGMLAIVTAF